MVKARLSSKYQLVIPKAIRKETGLQKGENIIMVVKDGIIRLIPSHLITKMRGILKGVDLSDYRDERDRT